MPCSQYVMTGLRGSIAAGYRSSAAPLRRWRDGTSSSDSKGILTLPGMCPERGSPGFPANACPDSPHTRVVSWWGWAPPGSEAVSPHTRVASESLFTATSTLTPAAPSRMRRTSAAADHHPSRSRREGGCFGFVVHGNLNAPPGSTGEDAANISGSGPPPVALAQSKLARQAGFRVSALFRMPRLAPPRQPAVEQGPPVESGCTQNPPHSCCPLTEGRVIDDDR